MDPESSFACTIARQTDPFLSQIYAVHVRPSHFFKVYLNIILPSTSVFSEWSLYFRFSQQSPVSDSHLPQKASDVRQNRFRDRGDIW